MRILWHSNASWAPTGYGQQTRLFTPKIAALGHEVAVSAFYGLEGCSITWNGILHMPRLHHPFGADVIAAHSQSWRADVTISLHDVYVLGEGQLNGVRWCAWCPIDMEPMPPIVYKTLADNAFVTIAMSRYGENQCKASGLEHTVYVPHGIDTTVFTAASRKEARAKFQFPEDRFIVGMVAANKGQPSRKCIPQVMEAFGHFHRKRPDALLYLHTHPAPNGEYSGVNIEALCAANELRLGSDVLVTDPYVYEMSLPPPVLADLYRSMDVFVNPSMGEGFGIPIIEAQACGTPVIVGDWTAMSELCFGGWKIPKQEATRIWHPLLSWQFTPRTAALVDAMQQAYRLSGSERVMSDAALGVQIYDADRVVEDYWKPALRFIEQRLENSAETSPIQAALEA